MPNVPFTRAHGYVQQCPQIPNNSLSTTIFFGLLDTNTPDGDDILALTARTASNLAQTFAFTNADDDYLVVAVPVMLGRFQTFQIGQFPVSFPKTRMNIFVNGVEVGYEVHISTYRQHANAITAVVNVP